MRMEYEADGHQWSVVATVDIGIGRLASVFEDDDDCHAIVSLVVTLDPREAGLSSVFPVVLRPDELLPAAELVGRAATKLAGMKPPRPSDPYKPLARGVGLLVGHLNLGEPGMVMMSRHAPTQRLILPPAHLPSLVGLLRQTYYKLREREHFVDMPTNPALH